mmetsp:Transcript_10265/g.29057  ORF Transcript_10265/g.29057 Transcript_10265/m.29057 type:complete len:189 (-) Transcript_10265:2227-2793(-)
MITIYYWAAMKKFQGRGFPIALALEFAGVPYEVLGNDDLPESFCFAVPIVKLSTGQLMSQTPMIMDVLGSEFGLGGSTPAEKVDCKQLLLDFNDMFDEVQKDGKWTAENGRQDKWFALVEKRLQASKFLVSSEITVADLHAFWVASLIVMKKGKIEPEKYPKFASWFSEMSEVSAVKKLTTNGVQIFP